MKRVKLLCIAGTRPEAIKMAPVIQALHEEPWADCRVLATAQHRQMLDQVLRLFDIAADIDLDIMRPNQALNALTARLLLDLDAALEVESPDAVLAQGDTTTVMSAALACFHRRIPFGHVEAGLRTGDLGNPFPEEMNRVIASRLARWHFAPTERSRANLLREGCEASHIWVTGNTVIDALLRVAATHPDPGVPIDPSRRLILVTADRRENFGAPSRQYAEPSGIWRISTRTFRSSTRCIPIPMCGSWPMRSWGGMSALRWGSPSIMPPSSGPCSGPIHPERFGRRSGGGPGPR